LSWGLVSTSLNHQRLITTYRFHVECNNRILLPKPLHLEAFKAVFLPMKINLKIIKTNGLEKASFQLIVGSMPNK
jgi:hypothetical protein